ncbi:Colicin V production protein [Dissulfuribacter thermophilus]|uniref:Colicin V production protein n=1 Tax=Dissulfuribacter thermophilus TaxID=1156395 RepID=A0A1B9F888_9BACT|nr:CvpA family protein [Dissulfuribacter thermophilus]OCC16025.1 Colicin V production protein [Dissulfuribacter thermophilus]
MTFDIVFDIFGVHLNLLDLILGSIILYCLLRGIFLGFIRSFTGIIGILVGFWAAINFHPLIAHRLGFFIDNPIACFLIAFILIYLCVYVFFIITGHLLRFMIKALRLSWIDSALGVFLGLVKGMILVGIVCFLLTVLLPNKSTLLKTSFLYPRLTTILRSVTLMVPSDIKANFMWKWRRNLGQFDKKERYGI